MSDKLLTEGIRPPQPLHLLCSKLTAEKDILYADYYHLKDEVQKVETIKRNVERLTHVEKPVQTVKRETEL